MALFTAGFYFFLAFAQKVGGSIIELHRTKGVLKPVFGIERASTAGRGTNGYQANCRMQKRRNEQKTTRDRASAGQKK